MQKLQAGTVVSTVIADPSMPASVCTHGTSRRPMCTIIPVEKEPYWILSCWGNGPGITCLLKDYPGGPFYDVLVLEVRPNHVVGLPLEPNLEDFKPEEEKQSSPSGG
jgi:hypothetical protein